MPDEDTPDVKVVGGAGSRPRKPASDLASIRAKSRGGPGQHDADRLPEPGRPGRSATAGAALNPERDKEQRTVRTSTAPGPSHSYVDPLSVKVLAGAVAMFAVLALVFGLAWGFNWGHSKSGNVTVGPGSKQEREMSGVARQFLTSFTNFDPDTIDNNYNQILGLATGDFLNEWPTVFPDNVRQEIKQRRVQMRGNIQNFYIQDFKGNSGTVFAVVGVTYASNANPQPSTDTYRFLITLAKHGSVWKISHIDLLNSPAATSGLEGVSPSTGNGAAPSGSSGAPPASQPATNS